MIEILAILLPVFAMMLLGVLASKTQLITTEQSNGIKNLVFNILMPILIFNSLFTTKLDSSVLLVIFFVFCLHCIGLAVGLLTGRFAGGRFGHVSPYMLCTFEGGNIGIPLYLTLAGTARAGNIIMLDIAGLFIIFLVAPIVISIKSSQSADPKQMIKNIFTNTVVIAMILGAILNLLGLPAFLEAHGLYVIYEQTETMITGPIAALILFTIGYDFKLERNSLAPLTKVALTRILVMGCGIFAFMRFFPALVQDQYMTTALFLYFMCPPAFIMTSQAAPLVKSDDDAGFLSAFVSLYTIITLLVYIRCAIVLA